MNLLSLATVLTALAVAMAAQGPLPKEQMSLAMSSGAAHSCFVNNRVYRHGQIFTIGNSRCIKYICYDGNYYFHEEGCDMGNVCWPANQDFDYECRRYTCLVSDVGGGYRKYEVRPLSSQLCKDAAQKCHRPGVYFRYVMNGQLKERCTCVPGKEVIKYYCYD